MRIPILMPQLGESIAEATVKEIKIEVGQTVKTDEDVLEVETEKAMMEVTTPCPGKVIEVLVEVDVSYPVGSTLGYLEVDDSIAKKINIDSSELHTDKTIWIYLPKNYENSKMRFPVIYMHDAQNLFDAQSSYTGEWEIGWSVYHVDSHML